MNISAVISVSNVPCNKKFIFNFPAYVLAFAYTSNFSGFHRRRLNSLTVCKPTDEKAFQPHISFRQLQTRLSRLQLQLLLLGKMTIMMPTMTPISYCFQLSHSVVNLLPLS